MKISCLIDSLNSGGAQRQLCMLAVGLKQAGFEMEIFTYHPLDFFRPLIEQNDIPLQMVESGSKIQRIRAIRRAIRNSNPDIVISYLNTPNLLAELSGLPLRNFALIVSERNMEYGGKNLRSLRRFLLHLLADAVVTNSYAQAEFIKEKAPWLKSRLATIPNCVDLDRFRPAPPNPVQHQESTRVLVLGRFEQQKNPLALLAALEILIGEYRRTDLVVDWYGNDFFIDGMPTTKSSLYLHLKEEIERRSLAGHFRLHPPERDVVKLYQSATVLCLPSLHEGCSNVICEAMACGIPVLASRVGDNALLVDDGVSGFIFSPDSPRDIADALVRFISLSPEDRMEMGRVSRNKAEANFSLDEFVAKYRGLFAKLKKAEHRYCSVE